MTSRARFQGRDVATVDVHGFDAIDRSKEIWCRNGISVSTVLSSLGIRPSAGYRDDANGESVTISDDTRACDEVVALGHGPDILVHEVMRAKLMLDGPADEIIRREASASEYQSRCASALSDLASLDAVWVPLEQRLGALVKNGLNPFESRRPSFISPASHVQLRIRDTSGTRGGTICAQLLRVVAIGRTAHR